MLKFIWNCKGPSTAQTVKNKKERERIMFHTSQFQVYYKATGINTVWYCHKERHINGMELNVEINPHI